MFYSYGITQIGSYHVDTGTVCQDSHMIRESNEGFIVAAVADGLGSELYSDVASSIATEKATEVCLNIITADSDEEEILSAIKEGFSLALQTIEETVNVNKHSLDQYDTTLTLAVIHDARLFYGHAGDSGIVALTTDGRFEKITEQIRDDYGRVFPLFYQDKWVFGQYDGSIKSVMLSTDGLLEPLFPTLLEEEPVKIHASLAQFFMDPTRLHIEEDGEESTKARIEDFIGRIPSEQVNDDKTIVVIIDADAAYSKQDESYYSEPDWIELKRKFDDKWERELYPQRFDDQGNRIQENPLLEDEIKEGQVHA